ncbi:MAG: fibronectin type III domain-containing protein [Verrucomicrobiota bacterium]
MITKKLKVSLAFANAAQASVLITTGRVIDNLFDKPGFNEPPVTKVALQAMKTSVEAAIVGQKTGGPAATAHKNNLLAEMKEMLKLLAYYVQMKCENDLSLLLSTGFLAASTNTAQSQLPRPETVTLLNAMSGQMRLKTPVIANARAYQLELALIGADGEMGPWQDGGLHTKSQEILASGLTPGAVYAFRVRAVGGLTGYSDYSNAVSGRVL